MNVLLTYGLQSNVVNAEEVVVPFQNRYLKSFFMMIWLNEFSWQIHQPLSLIYSSISSFSVLGWSAVGHLTTLTPKVPFGWFSGECLIYSLEFYYSAVSLQA